MAQTEGALIYATDYQKYRAIQTGFYHHQTVPYTNLAKKTEYKRNTSTSGEYADTGGSPTRGLIYFYSGNTWVIPRKITYSYVCLDNMHDSSAQSGTCHIYHTRITHPSGSARAGGVSAGGTINASQLNSLYLELTAVQFSNNSVSLAAGAFGQYDLTAESTVPAASEGWVRLGIRSFATGYKHCMPYLLDAMNATPKIGIRNFAESATATGEVYITIVYGRVVEKSSAYRTRVSAGTVIDNTHLDLAKLNCNGRETLFYELSTLNNKEAADLQTSTTKNSSTRDSTFASYNQLGILNGFNSGKAFVLTRLANANTGRMVIVNYTGTSFVASIVSVTPGGGLESDQDDESSVTPRIYRALYYI